MPVSTDDYVRISDFIGRYCWAVDDGDVEGWVALWKEDGVFTGVTPEPLVGREALRSVPINEKQMADGKMRHMAANLCCDYIEGGREVVLARYYNFVTTWMGGGRFTCMALSEAILERSGDSWLIRRNDTVMFPG